jgi:NAD(P)-dependent dehydrogenase (short-subunit alcohol dehydrogenase family)
MKVENKVAIVTGGSRGIGKAIAIALAEKGYNVVICSRNINELNKAKEEIENFNVKVLAIKCDVRNYKEVKNLVNKTMEEFGRIDILINNAGIALKKSVIDTSEEEWDNVIDTNLKAPFLLTKEVLPIMVKQKSGCIVNISSGAGKSGFAEFSAYCASKFGLIGFTESLAKEVKNNGIRVYAICPGPVATKMQEEIVGKMYPFIKPFIQKPEDVAKFVIDAIEGKYESGSVIDTY